MSQLSQFFPSGGGGTAINLVMVGGGGGAGAAGGAGGGGYFYGRVCIQPGVSYPITIGAGGSPGCPTSCATTAGLGNPGSPSKFGKFEALGGGGGATNCSSYTFAIMGSAGGSAGGMNLSSPYDASKFSLSGSSQRSLSPNGYCGAYGSRIDTGYHTTLIGTRTSTGTQVCPEFFGVCLASMPYTYSPAPTVCCLSANFICAMRAGCSRTYCCSQPYYICCSDLYNYTNSAHGARSTSCNGDSGVVLVAYPCALPAATAFPGATDCSPVSIPQNGFRTYKFTTSGSFTL